MGWRYQQEPVDLSTFDPEGDYTVSELDAFASQMLKEDIKQNGNIRHVLLKDHLAARDRREIKVDATQIDGKITDLLPKSDRPVNASGDGQMMYNRTHPKGRKVNSIEQRRANGASFFR